MTSVPKPLKFLRPHYQTLKAAYERLKDESNRRKLADVISVLAITTGKEGDRESLKFRLLGSKVSTVIFLTLMLPLVAILMHHDLVSAFEPKFCFKFPCCSSSRTWK